MTVMIKILVAIIVMAALLLAYVRFLEATTLFLPSRKVAATPEDIGLDHRDVYFKTKDGLTLNGWFVPSSTRVPSETTLLFMHGNAGNIGDRLDKILLFHQMGLNVFIFDYRGYGKSEGRATEGGVYLDAEAAYAYLIKQDNLMSKRIVVCGASLGGAVAVDLASKQDVDGLILISTFSSAADMAKVVVPFVPSPLLSIKLDSSSKIKNILIPKLVIHSSFDEIVPIALGRKLYDAASQPKEFLEIIGGHNEGYAISRTTFVGGILAFLRKHKLLKI